MASDINTDMYRARLVKVRRYLAEIRDGRWPRVLDEWLRDLPTAAGSPDRLEEHLKRSRRGISGMGSLGDLYITPEAGHLVAADDSSIRQANNGFLVLVRDLDREIGQLLGNLAAR